MRYPTIKDLEDLVKAVKQDIQDDYRAYETDTIPGILLTVGADAKGDWSYQTGDNSFTGGAYHYPCWGVVGVYRRSSSREVARDLKRQIEEAQW